MNAFKQTNQSQNTGDIQIRDEKGIVYNRITNPGVVFTKSCGTLHKVCEREAALAYFNLSYDAYASAGFQDMANDLCYMELPRDQALIDDVFQITGYIKRLYEQSITGTYGTTD